MPNRSLSPRSTARAVLCLAVQLTLGAAAPIKPDLLAGLVWRNVGPLRATMSRNGLQPIVAAAGVRAPDCGATAAQSAAPTPRNK
jgi:hypothetical protein